jgi:hypothetical protein
MIGALSPTMRVQVYWENVEFSVMCEFGNGDTVLKQTNTGDDSVLLIDCRQSRAVDFQTVRRVVLDMWRNEGFRLSYPLLGGLGSLRYYVNLPTQFD